jgi:hypothetical protein
VPNELRISLNGNFKGQVGHIFFVMRSGYVNCKVVGRGSACERIKEIVSYLQKNAPQYSYHIGNTKSLNRIGMVVDEMHLLITNEERE